MPPPRLAPHHPTLGHTIRCGGRTDGQIDVELEARAVCVSLKVHTNGLGLDREVPLHHLEDFCLQRRQAVGHVAMRTLVGENDAQALPSNGCGLWLAVKEVIEKPHGSTPEEPLQQPLLLRHKKPQRPIFTKIPVHHVIVGNSSRIRAVQNDGSPDVGRLQDGRALWDHTQK